MLLKQSSTARPLVFLMVDSSDHVTGKTGLSPTVTISKNGGSFASPSGSVTEIANGVYKVAGNATDTDTLGPLVLHASATGADPVDVFYEVVVFDPSDAVRMGLTALPNANAEASGGLITRGTSTGQMQVSSGNVTVADIVAAALAKFFTTDTTKVYADAVTGSVVKELASNAGGGSPPSAATIADAVWDEALSGHLTSGTTGAALNAAGSAGDPWATSLPGSYGSGTAGNIIGNRIDAAVTSRLAPTTNGRTLDVSSTGGAGIDWSNVESPTTTLNLSGTTVGTANTIGTTGLAAIWDRLTSAITTANSIGKLIIDKLGLITSTTSIQTNGLVSTGTTITIFQGETVNATSGNIITLAVDHAALNLTGFTPKLALTKLTSNSGTSTLSVTGTVNNAGTTGQSITFALTSAQTAALALSTGGVLAGGMYANPALIYAYRWEMSATDGSSNCPTLGTGYVDVKPRATSC